MANNKEHRVFVCDAQDDLPRNLLLARSERTNEGSQQAICCDVSRCFFPGSSSAAWFGDEMIYINRIQVTRSRNVLEFVSQLALVDGCGGGCDWKQLTQELQTSILLLYYLSHCTVAVIHTGISRVASWHARQKNNMTPVILSHSERYLTLSSCQSNNIINLFLIFNSLNDEDLSSSPFPLAKLSKEALAGT